MSNPTTRVRTTTTLPTAIPGLDFCNNRGYDCGGRSKSTNDTCTRANTHDGTSIKGAFKDMIGHVLQ